MSRNGTLVLTFLLLLCSAWAQLDARTKDMAAELKIIDGPKIETVTDKTAQIAWSTDVEASAAVHYGTDKEKLALSAMQEWGGYKTQHSAVHRVTLNGLQPGTTYYFRVESGEGWHRTKSSVARSEVGLFTTKAVADPANPAVHAKIDQSAVGKIQPGNIMAGPLAADVTARSALLWWMTTDPSAGELRYGSDSSHLEGQQVVPPGEVKKLLLKNLRGNTTYYFQVRDGLGKTIADGGFRTQGDDFDRARFRITRGPVVEMVGKDSAVIAWSTNARSSTQVHYGITPEQLDQVAMAPWGQQSHRVTLRSLKPDTKYYFQIESAQAQGTGLSAKGEVAPLRTVAEGQAALRNPDWQD